MTGDGFDDAFADDEAAELERARRRARRAMLRRERTDGAPEGAPAETDDRSALAPAGPDVAAEPGPERAPIAGTGEVAGQPAAEPHGAGGGGVPPRRPRSSRRGAAPASGGQLWARRALGIGALILVALVAYVGVTAVADRLDGGASDQQLGETASGAETTGKTIDVVIPEGLDRSQIAPEVKAAGVEGDYESASESVSKKVFDPADYGAESPSSLEGFLFPATYEIPRKKPTADELVGQQLTAFRDYFEQVDLKYAESKNLTPYDVVIIASMIEREVSVPSERKLVAAVIYNRLSQGMPLQIDATTRFATGNFDQPLTESELASDSPYNTRINPGLPPGPIGNPGLASLKAAASPAKEDFLFYVVEPGTCNRHVFTASQAEFDQAAAEYQAALEEQGGSPTSC
ncbi:endolytic transglycosylase MltG [Thermoleophilia bacterium SCSIO 60948]|nr:endolytic transglycosylase MltG [Thermoleophilia bacterium SCSIO 60948]